MTTKERKLYYLESIAIQEARRKEALKNGNKEQAEEAQRFIDIIVKARDADCK